MVTKVFWALVVLDIAGMMVLSVLASRGPSSPEGPVGGWLVFIPPIVLVAVVLLVVFTRSEAVKMACVWILAFPWILVVVGPVLEKVQHYRAERSLAGDEDFRGGTERKLAHAIVARDAALVKSLIPLAGDLNQIHGTETFLSFAVSKAPDGSRMDRMPPPASVEIVRALLDAGAKADLAVPPRLWPLSSAMYAGPEVTELLLRAGANPNHLDDAGRPLWWQVLSDDTDRGVQTLEILLDHGADLKLRDREGGPIGWAAYHARAKYTSSWRAVWMLIQRGAPWRGEQEFGQPVESIFARDFAERKEAEVTEEMRKIQALFNAQ